MNNDIIFTAFEDELEKIANMRRMADALKQFGSSSAELARASATAVQPAVSRVGQAARPAAERVGAYAKKNPDVLASLYLGGPKGALFYGAGKEVVRAKPKVTAALTEAQRRVLAAKAALKGK